MRRRHGSLVSAGLLILGGCAGREHEPKVQFQEVAVAVSAPCVSGRPAAVPSLRDSIPPSVWAARAPGAKAAAIEAQAGDRMNYQDRLNAATAGCREAR